MPKHVNPANLSPGAEPSEGSQRRIRPLSTLLANQIAAGEVIERPASVVKELLENSLDAGASQLEIDIEKAGSRLIRIRDNGCGIHRDDLSLAVMPHATSKIYSQEELGRIETLGFRGEALASIASVSRLTLTSRYRGEEMAWQLTPGVREASPASLPAGTLIEVHDLFYNTPARRKFLRSERTEFLHIEELCRRVALSRFDVALRLSHNGRTQLNFSAASDEAQRRRRIEKLFGRPFLASAHRLDEAAAGMQLSGWLGGEGYSRSHTDQQYFYLNGRMVRDKLINHALRQAFEGQIESGRHPAYLLFLEIDPRQVDVNVHPTKHEVRFREARMVHDFLYRMVARNAGEVSLQQKEVEYRPAPLVSPRFAAGESPLRGTGSSVDEVKGSYRLRQVVPPPRRRGSGEGKPLGLFRQRYLLIETEVGLRLLDLLQLERTLLAQQLRKGLEEGEVVSRPLLIPESVSLSPADFSLLEEHTARLERLGMRYTVTGEGQVLLRTLPAALGSGAATGVMASLLVTLRAGEVGAGALIRVLATAIDEPVRFTNRSFWEAALEAAGQLDAEEARGLSLLIDEKALLSGFKQ